MATTWIKALHKSGGIAAALGRSVGYIENADKTNGGELVYGYECNPVTAASEFLLSKRQYERITGRNQGKHDVIAYHIRMSFKHGEVTATQALELGRELAMRWTKGRHQFVVAAHTNTNNPHVHIIYNSVNLDCDGKYKDFRRSAIALRRVSDQICLEHGLSVVEKPGLSKGHNRAEYLGGEKASSVRGQLRSLMDVAIASSKDFSSFLDAIQVVGVEVKCGKQLAYKLPGGKRFVRQDSFGDDYSYDSILERISGKRVVAERQKTAVDVEGKHKLNLLIDIQSKIREGKGSAYEHWARVFNIKQLSKTLLFLNGIDSYEDLLKKSDAVSAEYDMRLKNIKEVDTRLAEISELQKHIGIYGKTRETYKVYMALPSKKREDYFEANRADISLHKAAKKYFNGLVLDKKLPTISSLKQEYATLAARKKRLYSGYYDLRDNHRALLTAKGNAQRLLGMDGNVSEREVMRRQNRERSYER